MSPECTESGSTGDLEAAWDVDEGEMSAGSMALADAEGWGTANIDVAGGGSSFKIRLSDMVRRLPRIVF